MTRIISGRYAGRRLRVPPKGTRPTSDRVREALFSILAGRGALHGTVLDLFAGSGALGFEALSRGATALVAVESSRAATRILRDNAADLHAPAQVREQPVERYLRGTPTAFDLVLVDPPYAADVDDVVVALAGGWVSPEGTVVVERAARSGPPVQPALWEPWEERRYGETTLWLSASLGGAP